MGKTYKDKRKQYTSYEDYEISVKKKQNTKFRRNRKTKNKDLKELVI